MSFSRIASAALVAALGAASVRAHGIVSGVLVDGSTYYEAYNPFQDPYMNPVPDRVSRPVPGNGPIEDVTSDDLRCNGGKSANLVATAGAGSSIDMQWTAWPDSHKGPVITYMAQVPASEDVKTWDPTDAVWFKVDEAGLEDGKWAATDIMIANNNTWTWQVPSDLAAGNYLVRHEIIALHSAGSYPGAQLYPMCLQLEVTGSGSSMASASDMVAFPGGYTPDTPGIVFDIYNGATDYPIPGPALWSGAGGSGSGSGSGSASSAASSAAPSTSAAASTSAAVSTFAAASTSAAATSAVSSAPAETSAPATSATESSAAATSAASSAASAPASSAPAASSASATSEAASSAPAATSAAATTSASAPATTGIVDANACMNTYNQCIAKSQPNPDWTGCGATKDSCLATATYNVNMAARAKRDGKFGRLLL